MMFRYFIVSGLLFLLVSCNKENVSTVPEPSGPTPLVWKQPAHFPEPVYDLSSNSLTEEGVELGRFLFYDGRLSRTNNIGCGTCHQQPSAFTHHGHELSHGVDDLLGTRNSPAVQNVAWQSVFFWDGGVHGLDFVPLNPIGSEVEMDETIPNIIAKLNKTATEKDRTKPNYPLLFKRAFGTEEINTERIMKSLSQFMLTMISAGSRYDYYKMGDNNALTEQEKRGMSTFKTHCGGCHSGELFTDFSFRNNGLVPMKINDKGLGEITGNERDHYRFKVPSLRNVGITAPYMHDGRYHTLSEVMDHYTNNIRQLPNLDSTFMQPGGKTGLQISAAEKQDIIAFLHTLSDDDFRRNQKLADPGIGNAL